MTPRSPRPTALGAAAVLLAGGLLTAAPPAQAVGNTPATPANTSSTANTASTAKAASTAKTQRTISPTPRSVTNRSDHVTITPTVTLVTGATSDGPSLDVVESALRKAGAQHVVRGDRPGGSGLTVYVGDTAALAAQHLDGPSELPADGYVLGIGADRIVLAGKDTTGTYYAAQTLRQVLPQQSRPGAQVAGIAVRDWPGTALRGVIEGFYGTPWSHEARLDQLDYYGEHKMNIYVYSPKDDAYLRAKWRDAYPAEQLAQIKELADRATQRHVDFTYALSPGLSVCYSSDADIKALVDKFQTIWDIGVRTFAVPLDDISYTDWNCAEDKEKWGTGGAAAGAAQAYLLNRVNKEFIATHPGAQPLQMVPTEYYNVSASPYKQALSEQLDPDVLVEWTGVGVVAPTMTVAQAEEARTVFGHPILTWDNYPVNDYTTDRLLLGPFNGREKGLPGKLAGITANPMIQPYASKIALHTVADYAWNDTAYDPRTSWLQGIKEYAGGDARTEKALRAFADINYSSSLNSEQAPDLAAAFDAYWTSGDATRLTSTLTTLGAAPDRLRDSLPDRGFIADAGPWLDATKSWATAARTALRMVEAARAGKGAQAWELRQQVPAQVTAAKSFTYTGLDGRAVPVVVVDGVLDRFIDAANAEYDRILGISGRPTASATLGTWQSNAPARMLDGDDSTYFWSDRSPAAGDGVTVDLGRTRELGDITLAMAKPTSPDDYLHEGVLEYSVDGQTWQQLAAFAGKPDVTATVPAGTSARYVRARATADQENWLVVREFDVTTKDGAVTGGPPAATGFSLRAAADADPNTVYRAARAPEAGDALQTGIEHTGPVRSVTVLRPTGTTGRGDIQLRGTDGTWRTIGTLDGAYTKVSAGGRSADAVRLLWGTGTAAPQVAEVVVTGQD
ncbi:beta-N-acetylglucosaminidase domain-containing protein [Streptomyces sp. RY43-2]|uniref:Beta-N-acetylglucosaminidase domain-containing protein n=1 Tax=Streptomyces macrolidinus TaxID=2952607 RepID=A0ABT0ZMQ9_9ACTN|nr:beta-N-acetylglucosaminidase domain-containing protein [Streptomyces macrolidinus]MCN9244872.1 beta-N-acetylglucosaminidase domain-containing protein [Streptomyces macrolidinus]